MTNDERELWIKNHVSLHLWWKNSKLSMSAFIQQNHVEIDQIIKQAKNLPSERNSDIPHSFIRTFAHHCKKCGATYIIHTDYALTHHTEHTHCPTCAQLRPATTAEYAHHVAVDYALPPTSIFTLLSQRDPSNPRDFDPAQYVHTTLIPLQSRINSVGTHVSCLNCAHLSFVRAHSTRPIFCSFCGSNNISLCHLPQACNPSPFALLSQVFIHNASQEYARQLYVLYATQPSSQSFAHFLAALKSAVRGN